MGLKKNFFEIFYPGNKNLKNLFKTLKDNIDTKKKVQYLLQIPNTKVQYVLADEYKK